MFALEGGGDPLGLYQAVGAAPWLGVAANCGRPGGRCAFARRSSEPVTTQTSSHELPLPLFFFEIERHLAVEGMHMKYRYCW
jgi:hypothetical protein